jgi:CBS-domain-containing membrane protein
MLFAEDTIWHFWIAVPLALGAILVVLGIVALYFFKVTRTRYPKERA